MFSKGCMKILNAHILSIKISEKQQCVVTKQVQVGAATTNTNHYGSSTLLLVFSCTQKGLYVKLKGVWYLVVGASVGRRRGGIVAASRCPQPGT